MGRLTILVAEDNPSDRLILSSLLERQGHEVLVARHGGEAVELFGRHRPQLVLMDLLMPVMDGLEAARRIKRQGGDALVPLIFLTSMSEHEALVDCLEAGGDDFLSKPYNPTILKAKILAMNRLRQLQATVIEQRDLIARQHARLLQEQEQARAIFDKVAHGGCLDSPNIRYHQSPMALFNGDLLFAAPSPAGTLMLLLGDFTGHGLPAAVGAMPLAEIFYNRVPHGYSCNEILCELNAKLVGILPVEMFCCAMLLEIDPHHHLLKVWNGALPEGYLLRADGSRQALVSRHLPLGVLGADVFDDHFEAYPLQARDRLLLYTDGVSEGRDGDGRMFGGHRLQALLAGQDREDPHAGAFERVKQALQDFLGPMQDDLTLVEVSLDGSAPYNPGLSPPAPSLRPDPLDWSSSVELRGPTLRDFNPLPLILQVLLQVQELRPQASTIYTVLAELYSNALEHGVLGLDSALKRDVEGFARYYALREQRLQALTRGWVRIAMDFRPTPEGGCLRLGVLDSGEGFNVAEVLDCQRPLASLCGRGLQLVRRLSDRIDWLPRGNGVTAEFHWRAGGESGRGG